MQPEALRKMVESRRPFSLRLADGTLIPVPRPEFIFLTQDGKTAIVNTRGSALKILDGELVITALETGSPNETPA